DVLRDRHRKPEKPRRTPSYTKVSSGLPSCNLVSFVAKKTYIIAVAGAGSSVLPAFARGTRIITMISTASAARATRTGGVQGTSVTFFPDPTRPAITRPHNASPAISPDAVS